MNPRLVYDVGAFDGADTAYYLQRGYDVVSLEADPQRADQLKARFAEEIARGQCVVLGVGVAAEDGEATFYINERVPVWSSFDRERVARGGDPLRELKVPCRTFPSILREHGVPFFLKVDIEGLDHLCVRALESSDLPAYVSFEAGSDTPALIAHLTRVGFNRFRLVDQQGWAPVVVPRAGTGRHTLWSLRQWARLGLRRVPPLHRGMQALRRGFLSLKGRERPLSERQPHRSGTEEPRCVPGSSGPLPSEHQAPWIGLAEFMHLWVSADEGGILESSWFDVHAARQE